ncbi:MAG: hypothetical protein J5701_03540 [Bacteroidales bacterium]|nr:hypothetical protein [Bacteroidales bacterium]
MFKKLYGQYIKFLLIFSIIIAVIYICFRLWLPFLVSVNLPFLIIAFLLVTAIMHYFVAQADAQRIEFRPDINISKEERMKMLTAIERKFITRYLLVTTVKLLGFLVLLTLYACFNRQDFLLFGANFLVIYIMYSLFEIIYLKKPVVGKKS